MSGRNADESTSNLDSNMQGRDNMVKASLLITLGVVLGAIAVKAGEYMALRQAAMECARTTEDFSDQGIVKCFTDRGLPPPKDL